MNSCFFVGYPLSSELKVRLRETKPESLIRLSQEGKEYLGIYIDATFSIKFSSLEKALSLHDIRVYSKQALMQLQKVIPDYRFIPCSLVIFPILLIG